MNDKFITGKKETFLVLDAANLYMRCLYGTGYDPTDDNFTMYKIQLLRSLQRTLLQFNPDRVIVCQEGFHNWRKELYPSYKANRITGRQQSAIDFDKFFSVNDKFVEDFKNIAKNIEFLRVARCEADDLVATVVKTQQQANVIVQSNDRDFYQLFKYKNYKQWNAHKQEFVQVANPESYLTEKIILGDVGDNVPRISGLKRGQGPKYVERAVLPNLDEWLEQTNSKADWERNYKLISFDAIPEELTTEIANQLFSWQKGKFDAKAFYNFMLEHKLGSQIDYVADYVNTFSKV